MLCVAGTCCCQTIQTADQVKTVSETPPNSTSQDRRSKRRYTIHLPLQIKVTAKRRVARTGTGNLLNISSDGIAFTSDVQLRTGMSVSLYISWPVLLDGKTRLMLVVAGKVVRTDGELVAVRTVRCEFRTQKAGRRDRVPS